MTITSLFENGVIHQDGGPVAEALVAEDGAIVLVGTNAECRRAAKNPHEVVDLGGAHVVPGFTDSHVHTAQLAMQASELDMSTARSCHDAVRLVGRALEGRAGSPVSLTATGWLLGRGWSSHEWPDAHDADRVALDSVSAGTPVAVHSADLHTYWLNTPALSRLGIDRHTPDPPGGGIGRSADREPTGIVSEAAAFAVQSRLETDSQETLGDGILRALRRFLALGVTGIHDLDGATAFSCLSALATEGRLPVRVHKLTPVWEMDQLIERRITSGCGDDWLNFGGVKVFADGSLSSHTCLLHTDFLDQPGNTGMAVTALDELKSVVQRCDAHGLSVAVHAIGDAAVSHALDALAGSRPHAGVPHRIEHFQHARAEDVRRAAAAGVVACMQPSSCTTDIDLVEQALGARDLVSYGWKSLLMAGVPVAFSSDAPVEDINPFAGLHAATTRQRPDSTPLGGWQPHERLSRKQAFACYTRGSALASGRGGRAGSLSAGRLADFAVLDRDPFAVDDEALIETNVTMTVVGGHIGFSQ